MPSGGGQIINADQKEALATLDEYIKSRFLILIMLDVATGMPLGWVVAETPNADAALALFRMATRDKSREKRVYGCRGEPAAAVGLMHVKNDNGPGLRNSTTVEPLLDRDGSVAQGYRRGFMLRLQGGSRAA